MEKFDPKNVDRKEGMTWDLSEHGGRECVLASDYDQLLELYKAEIKSKPLMRIVPFRDGYWVFAEDFSFFVKPLENREDDPKAVHLKKYYTRDKDGFWVRNEKPEAETLTEEATARKIRLRLGQR